MTFEASSNIIICFIAEVFQRCAKAVVDVRIQSMSLSYMMLRHVRPLAKLDSILPGLHNSDMWQLRTVQELSNILEALTSQRASSGTAADGADLDDDAAEEDDDNADADNSSGKAPAGLLQTFVFSATLTLPQKLRKRLRRGGLEHFLCTGLLTGTAGSLFVQGCLGATTSFQLWDWSSLYHRRSRFSRSGFTAPEP